MRKGALIFARLSSKRLPRKAFARIGNKRVIDWVLDSCRELHVDERILATSNETSDDELAEYVSSRGYSVYRGDLDDVYGRALSCAEEYGLDAFARINGDSPFTDINLIDKGFEKMISNNLEFISNIIQRTYPYGVSCEVIRTSLLQRYDSNQYRSVSREHITQILYQNLDSIRHGSMESEENFSDLKLTVDLPGDLKRIQRIYDYFGNLNEIDFVSIKNFLNK